jgi:hypothetical protein
MGAAYDQLTKKGKNELINNRLCTICYNNPKVDCFLALQKKKKKKLRVTSSKVKIWAEYQVGCVFLTLSRGLHLLALYANSYQF